MDLQVRLGNIVHDAHDAMGGDHDFPYNTVTGSINVSREEAIGSGSRVHYFPPEEFREF
jgi:hypothetical protein